MGTAWEKHLEYLLLANNVVVERPTEFVSPEGIAYSPDLIFFNGETRLGEIKYTSMSAKDMPTEVVNSLPPKLNKYLTQMMLYAYWLGVSEGWLAILFNYTPWAPDLRIFGLHFEEHEKANAHRMCMNYARHRGLLK
jgi:Uma2 family endonuclease